MLYITGASTVSCGFRDNVWKIVVDGKRIGPAVETEADAQLICDWLRGVRTMEQQKRRNEKERV